MRTKTNLGERSWIPACIVGREVHSDQRVSHEMNIAVVRETHELFQIDERSH